jgi:hypothetical protein
VNGITPLLQIRVHYKTGEMICQHYFENKLAS